MQLLANAQSFFIRSLVFLLPVFFLTTTSDFFNLNKLALVVILSLLALFAWSAGKIRESHFNFQTTPFDLPVLLFGLGVLCSAIVSTDNKLDGFVFPGTASMVLAGVGIYFLITQYLGRSKKDDSEVVDASRYEGIVTVWVWGVVLASFVTLLAAVGLFAALGNAMPLPVWLKQPFFSPIGGVVPTILFSLLTAPLIFGRVMQAIVRLEKSGFDGRIAVVLLGFVVFMVSSALVLYQALPTKQAGFRTLPLSSGWSIALETLKWHPLFGVGPGDFSEAFNKFRPVQYNFTKSWNVAYNASTNWYFDIFTTAGLAGLVTFLLILFVLNRKWVLVHSKKIGDVPYVKASLAVCLFIFVFSPANITLIIGFFILLGLFGSFLSRSMRFELSVLGEKIGDLRPSSGQGINLMAFVIALSALVVLGLVTFFGGRVYAADMEYRRALGVIAAGGKYNDVLKFLERAIQLNTYSDSYRRDYSQTSVGLVSEILAKKEISEDDREDVTKLVQVAIAQGKAAIAINPNRSANWVNLAQVYVQIMPIAQGADAFAVSVYKQAISLEPANPGLRIALGGVYFSLGDYDGAIRTFDLAVSAKPDLANAHYNLAVAFGRAGKLDSASAEMQKALSLLEPGSKDYNVVRQELEGIQKELKASSPGATASAQPVENSADSQSPIQGPKNIPSPAITPKIELPSESNPPATSSATTTN